MSKFDEEKKNEKKDAPKIGYVVERKLDSGLEMVTIEKIKRR